MTQDRVVDGKVVETKIVLVTPVFPSGCGYDNYTFNNYFTMEKKNEDVQQVL